MKATDPKEITIRCPDIRTEPELSAAVLPAIDELPTEAGAYLYKGRAWIFSIGPDGLRGFSYSPEEQLFYGNGKLYRRGNDGRSWGLWAEQENALS